MWASHRSRFPCGGFSCGGERALEHMGSVGVARGLAVCPVACGIFPDQGLSPRSLRWYVGSQPVDQQESPREVIFEDAYQNAQLELFLSPLGQPVKRDSLFSRRDRTWQQTCKHLPDIMQAMKIKDFLPFSIV